MPKTRKQPNSVSFPTQCTPPASPRYPTVDAGTYIALYLGEASRFALFRFVYIIFRCAAPKAPPTM